MTWSKRVFGDFVDICPVVFWLGIIKNYTTPPMMEILRVVLGVIYLAGVSPKEFRNTLKNYDGSQGEYTCGAD